jgi:multicomponent Na+:H+ antiporter subunit F
MNSAQDFLSFAEYAALVLFSLSFLLTIYRVIVGPTLPDRIIGLDMLVIVAVGFIAVIGVRTSFTLFVDVSIALALVGFLATVAFARFVLSRGALWARLHEEDKTREGDER